MVKITQLIRNKNGEHFRFALLIISLSIAVISIAFVSEDGDITGYATATDNNLNFIAVNPQLIVFDNVNALGTLAPGNYYVDADGVVYWADDELKPAIAKVSSIHESQKNREIYIDNDGHIGYLVE